MDDTVRYKDKVRISSQAKTMSSMAKAYDKLRVDYDKLRVDYDKLVEAKTTKDEKNSDKTPCDHEMCVCGHELNHHWAVWKKSPYDDEKPLNPSYAREFTPMQCEECDCKNYEMKTETKKPREYGQIHVNIESCIEQAQPHLFEPDICDKCTFYNLCRLHSY